VASKPSIEQAIANNIKVARTLIRLRHSVEADDELNAVIPRIRVALEAQAQQGAVTGLSFAEFEQLLLGPGE
jgi:hypothetical protein